VVASSRLKSLGRGAGDRRPCQAEHGNLWSLRISRGRAGCQPRFRTRGIVGAGWSDEQAPEIHRFLRSLKVGDIVYIKAYSPSAPDLHVKAIGLVASDDLLTAAQTNGLVQIGRRVRWIVRNPFAFPKPHERNNVRANTIYEEFHPDAQRTIIDRLSAATER